MARALKYQYEFTSFAGDQCLVKFYFEGWEGGLTRLNPGPRAFVLREYNSSNDFFKPIRPFQAEMEILSDKVTTDDFIADADDDISVEFTFGTEVFWTGWLIQDDFQENWIDTNHYITLRATDGLGEIGSQSLPEVEGPVHMLDYLANCITNTAIGSGILVRTFVNNLFYEDILNRNDGRYTPLNQIYVDTNTFEGDNKLTVLEKINKAWSMTLYQWKNRWFFARMEEWLTNLPIRGLNQGLASNTQFTKTYEVNIGTGEMVKPIMPEMLKTLRRAFKISEVKFLNEFPQYILRNQLFQRGTEISTDKFTVADWTRYQLPLDRTVTSSIPFYREIARDGNGNIIDNYVRMENNLGDDEYITTLPFWVNQNDTIDISFDFRFVSAAPYDGIMDVAYILFQGRDSGLQPYYTADNDGIWYFTQNLVTNVKKIFIDYDMDPGTEWRQVSVTTNGAPRSGVVWIYLLNSVPRDTLYKNLQINITRYQQTYGVIGDYDRYTLPQNILQNYDEQTYLDDANNPDIKGALLWYDADTEQYRITGDRWFRMDFPDERLTFKREKAIAHMTLNRRARRLLQVNMLGNVWVDESRRRPIWLQNKFIFTDDAPTKKWMIVNLSEMDFSSTEWKAQLIEVWDSDIDSNDPAQYPPHTFGDVFE